MAQVQMYLCQSGGTQEPVRENIQASSTDSSRKHTWKCPSSTGVHDSQGRPYNLLNIMALVRKLLSILQLHNNSITIETTFYCPTGHTGFLLQSELFIHVL